MSNPFIHNTSTANQSSAQHEDAIKTNRFHLNATETHRRKEQTSQAPAASKSSARLRFRLGCLAPQLVFYCFAPISFAIRKLLESDEVG